MNDLLDVSRIVSGRLRLDVEPVALSDVVMSAVDAVRPAAVAKNIQMTTTAVEGDQQVLGDPIRLQQVTWNLLSNAVKFTPAGGRIEVHVAGSGDYAMITVSDTGPGIEDEFLPHAFDRFRQGASGTTRAHGGLGLGLAIVRHLVELHGGTVAVANNTPPPGTAYPELWVPVASFKQQMQALAGAGYHGVTLDQVENNWQRRIALPVNSKTQPVPPPTPGCPPRPEQLIHALMMLQTWQPRVLVSDIEMSGQDGYELMQRVRTLPVSGRGLVTIALTAHARPEERLRALDAGFQWHLAKPVDPGELIGVIAALAAQAGAIADPSSQKSEV